MTVCIAALCGQGNDVRAVVAADRMVTLGSFIEFEHAMPKMTQASPYAIAMIAGDSLVGARLAREVGAAVSQSSPPIAEIAQEFASGYMNVRNARMQEDLLTPRALDLGSYYGAHNSLNPQIVAMIDNFMAQYNLGVEVLLAGVDPSGAHIYTVMNPGGADRLNDFIGYAAIGSGSIHAIQSMIGFRHSPDAGYHETIFRAYASKRRAEVAPGVGSDTDMAVISAAGAHWLAQEELNELEAIYEEFQAATDAELDKKLQDFSLKEAVDDDPADAEESPGAAST